jgi:hypothetical protein
MSPVLSAFSSPPMRCSSPGVPGTAHGRARVAGSRRYGRNVLPSSPLGFEANSTVRSGRSSTTGSSHGSEPLAMYPSESRMTGVRYVSAMRAASIAA